MADASVLFLCPFDLSRYRGTALRARMTIDALRAAFPCDVICRGGGGNGSVVLDAGWRGGTGVAAYLRPLQFGLWAAPHVVRRVPRVVHTFDTVSSLPAITRWKRRLGVRVVVELHGLASAEMGKGGMLARPLAAWLERFILRRADGIIAMSHSQREYLVSVVGVPAERVHVIWGPVDLTVFRFREAEETGALRVGYSGNDFRWQGVDDCLAAAGRIANERDIEFLFVTGSGWRTEATGLHRVRFSAAGTREQTAESLAGCHVLVSPRKGRAANLQYPFKLSSYLAVGRPVIATDVSDQRRIVEGANCGLVITPGTPEDLAGAILRLRDEGAQGRREMGQRARRFAEEHLSLERFHDALFSVYQAIGV